MVIISYGGTSIPILGRVRLRVWRGDFGCLFDCNLVDSKRVRPILGRKACLGMKIIKYLDNDQLNHPQTSDGDMYAHDAPTEPVLSADQLVKKFPRVFGDGVAKLPGEYYMELDETVKPVQHPPRLVPVAIREHLQETLEDLESQEIVARVTTPTPWSSSMVLDVACGFWHVVLDNQSSFLTTFNTLFGRYCWKRMPFGIKSAPEIFQRKMHKLIEGLNGAQEESHFAIMGNLQGAEKQSHCTETQRNEVLFSRRFN